MKKFISILLAALLFMSVFALGVSAETTEPGYLYFQVPTASGVAWQNFSMVYCHIWNVAGDSFYAWQAKQERCEDLGDGYWRYSTDGLDFDPEATYALIFSNENGMQTYDLTVTSECIGDIAYCEGDTCTNPVDSEKQCTVARWMNADVHPVVQVGSDGLWVNPDGIDTEVSQKFGESEGITVEMPAVEENSDDEKAKEEAIDDVDPGDVVTIGSLSDDGADASSQPGQSFNWVTILLIACCSAVTVVIVALVIALAKKNKKA